MLKDYIKCTINQSAISGTTTVIFGRLLVKWFALCYQTVVCCVRLSCPSETLVYCGWIKMKLGVELGLGPSHIVLDEDPAPPQRGTAPQFSVHVHCGQTAGWIKMPLGTEVGLGPGDTVRWGPSSLPKKGHSSPHFSFHVLQPNG